MFPVLLHFGPVSVFTYGAMLALGFTVCLILVQRAFVKAGLDKDFAIDLAVVFLFWGIVGARLFYVITHLYWFVANPIDVFFLQRGGLIFYGGLLVAAIVGILYIRKKKKDLALTLDTVIPYLALGQVFGRMGCFLNGCCWGAPADGKIGVIFPGRPYPVYPVQLYEAGAVFVLFVFLLWKQRRKKFPFEIFCLYFIGYSIIRFFLEYLRGDNPYILYNLTFSHVISIGIFIVATTYYIVRKIRR